MKKLLKVVVTIIFAIMLVLVAVPYLFKDKIEEIIKQNRGTYKRRGQQDA